MNVSPSLSPSPLLGGAPQRRIWTWSAAAAVVAALSGCSLLKNEEDGDQPPTQAEYRVSLSPFTISLSRAAPSVPISISAVCALPPGGTAPPECSPGFNPQWQARGDGWLSTTITDFTLQNTTATANASSSFFDHVERRREYWEGCGATPSVVLEIFPGRVPAGANVVGKRSVDVKVILDPPPGGLRDPGNSTRLFAVPAKVIGEARPNTPFAKPITVIYKGPPVFIAEISIDSNSFTLGKPPLPLPLENKGSFTVDVRYPATVAGTYTATLKILTDSGIILSVLIDLDVF